MSIQIKLISAQLSRDTQTFSNMDPFCLLQLGSESKRSKTKNQAGKKPIWNQTYNFTSTNNNLIVTVMDEDPVSDDLVGRGQLDISKFRSNTNQQREIVQLYYQNKAAGKVMLMIKGGNNGGNYGGNMGGNIGGNQGNNNFGGQGQYGQQFGNSNYNQGNNQPMQNNTQWGSQGQQGYQPGYQQGGNQQGGYQQGGNQQGGYQIGNQPGYQQGNQPGYQQGNQPGYQQGNQPGYQQGNQPGYQQGNQSGYQQQNQWNNQGTTGGQWGNQNQGFNNGPPPPQNNQPIPYQFINGMSGLINQQTNNNPYNTKNNYQ